MEGGDIQYMGGEWEVTQEIDPTSYIEQRYNRIKKEEEATQLNE